MRENDTSPARLLFVAGDDPETQAEAAMLSSGGFVVVPVKTCAEALTVIQKEPCDLILVNLDHDGDSAAMDLCRQVKDNPALAWMPVMFATRIVSKKSVAKIFSAGADEFVGKPCQPEELLVRARVLLRKGHEERWLIERARKLAERIAERDDELDDLRRFAQDIVSSLSSILLVLDADENILFVNAPFLAATNTERRNVVGHKLWDFFEQPAGDSNLGSLTRAIATAIGTGRPSRLRRIAGLLKQHRDRVSDVTVTAIDFGGARQVLMVVDDATEQFLAEAELQQERQKLYDVVNAQNAALCLIDRGCNLLWKNRTFELWFGDTYGQPGVSAFLARLRSDQSWIEQVFSRGQIMHFAWSVFTANGQTRYFTNIIARIKAVGSANSSGEGAQQALILTQDVTEQQTRVEQLTLLRELSQYLQETRDIERLKHVILLCCTTGHALGFNRAFLFTRNRTTGTLDAQMAVGPGSRDEALRIWSELSAQGRTLHDLFRGLENLPAKELMPLFPRIRGLHYSMDDSSEIIVRTALEKKEQLVTDAGSDPRVTPRFREIFGCKEFVSVPLVVKGAVVGVILADNLYSGRAITPEHVELLILFASRAALAIENAETYGELQDSLNRLRQAQQEIVHSEKLATIGKMAAHVAHEIRNPLSTIGGFARAIGKKPENAERVTKNARIIADEATRLETMLKSVMDFSRPSAPVRKRGDFNAIVERAFRTQAEILSARNVHSHLDLDRSIPEVSFDENQILQVLHNMILNAAESMPQGGALTLKTGRDRDKVFLTITDTGSGIPADVIERLFDPFFTTKPDGTGLGLAVSKKIIDDHGGHIDVQSEPGKGTTFKLIFPCESSWTSAGSSAMLPQISASRT